ncbi:tyrosine-type recombinase/integrase [Stappia albiluteola]|uniref:tyrosine-type recombinase/integrase n=1 Tax=Stappia albiluteola TaxID=2758565 RepID=UPI002E2C9FF5|nr:integrase arm-type DNA-binding domain-containing protein [Stappia albiluteola]
MKVRNENKPGRYADGNGLYLVVDPSGAKRWLLRTVVHGRRRDIGLGSLRLISLAQAREQAQEMRHIARSGGDPLVERRKQNQTIPSFEEAALLVHESYRGSWRNQKHRQQWINTLKQHVFPVFGSKRVDQVEPANVLHALSQIWLTKPETARRVKQRIGTILDWAKASGFRDGENPAAGVIKGLPKQPAKQRHHAALPYRQIEGFVKELRSSDVSPTTRLAFEFLILTACRTSEVLKARWDEIDFDAKIWTVPSDRMKGSREHRVPLSDRCLAILREARLLAGDSPYLFPGRSANKPLSNMVFLMVLRRMEREATAHGFRSTFRDWASECTGFPRDVCEMALAHTIPNKAEAAYRRGDLLEKRRELMEAWANFCEAASDNVVPMRV